MEFLDLSGLQTTQLRISYQSFKVYNNNLLISKAQVSTIGFSNARYKEQNVYNIS